MNHSIRVALVAPMAFVPFEQLTWKDAPPCTMIFPAMSSMQVDGLLLEPLSQFRVCVGR